MKNLLTLLTAIILLMGCSDPTYYRLTSKYDETLTPDDPRCTELINKICPGYVAVDSDVIPNHIYYNLGCVFVSTEQVTAEKYNEWCRKEKRNG